MQRRYGFSAFRTRSGGAWKKSMLWRCGTRLREIRIGRGRKKAARIALMVSQRLVEEYGLRPIVMNYPVSSPVLSVPGPEVLSLARYIEMVDGAMGVHLYFPCRSPDWWATWRFVWQRDREYKERGISLRYVATRRLVCAASSRRHVGPPRRMAGLPSPSVS